MKASFIRAAVAVFILAPALPVWSAEPSETAGNVKDDAKAAGHAVAHAGHAIADKSRETGHVIADKSRETGHSIADSTRSARDTVRQDSKKTGHTVAEGTRNLGRTIRDGFQRLKTGVTGKRSEPDPRG
ncbi:MAG TPA: hypothetical protein VGH84_04955 [Steroidobacteraceae bacterium]